MRRERRGQEFAGENPGRRGPARWWQPVRTGTGDLDPPTRSRPRFRHRDCPPGTRSLRAPEHRGEHDAGRRAERTVLVETGGAGSLLRSLPEKSWPRHFSADFSGQPEHRRRPVGGHRARLVDAGSGFAARRADEFTDRRSGGAAARVDPRAEGIRHVDRLRLAEDEGDFPDCRPDHGAARRHAHLHQGGRRHVHRGNDPSDGRPGGGPFDDAENATAAGSRLGGQRTLHA